MYYAVRIAMVAALAGTAFFSFRSARADLKFRAHSPEAVSRAVELAPKNAEYLEFRALQLDYDGADSTALLERAAALDTMGSAPRIRLGLEAEARGDFSTGEKWLLAAARIDRQFEPRWTLANFYFRRENSEEFWTWMRQALKISYGDRRPAFDLCWRISSDAPKILRRAIPGDRETVAAYLGYLLETRRVEVIAPVAMKLAAAHDLVDRDLLLGACDSLIAAESAAAAWDLWRAMGFRDADFKTGRGFDWRPIESPGVVHLDVDQPQAMHRMTFSGSQPESCDLLQRVLRLEPGARYILQWQSRPEFSGVEWRIGDQRAPLKDRQMQFTAASDLMTLALTYRRPPGEVRAEGSLELWAVQIRP